MTDKAKELVEKYYHLFSVELENTIDYREAKQCALIAIDEVIRALEEHKWQNRHVIEEYEQLKKEFYDEI